jgi:hypothetical protein
MMESPRWIMNLNLKQKMLVRAMVLGGLILIVFSVVMPHIKP